MNYTWIVLIVLLVGYFSWNRRGSSSIKRINAIELQERLASDPRSLEVIDVREPSEYKGGHIASANNIPLGGLSGMLNDIPKEKDVVFVCRSGNRSMMASRKAQKAGFKAVYNLTGGMSTWTGPVKK